MSVMVVVTVEGAVVNIHMLSAICEGILTLWVFLIFSEHQADMLSAFLVYYAVIQDGRFASDSKGVRILQNCPLAFLTNAELMR